MDSVTAGEVMEIIFSASRERGLTVLYVTHDEVLARAAQHVLCLFDRKIVRLRDDRPATRAWSSIRHLLGATR